ncbi:purine-nucleoside phosphorylase [Aquipuribacter nitratireducens]|uniref:Purine nucleoside phosphorylase n=1 Tax=Aquipuribacter nitratireducens TaxID=650104 RepID=A0ABW0GLH3_9MICO
MTSATDPTATTADQGPDGPAWQDLAARAAATVRERAGLPADAAVDTAVVLGSGWGQAADLLGEVVVDVAAADVPGFRASSVAGHHGRLRVVRTASGRLVLLVAARTHFYEGHGVDAVAHGVRTAAALGCRHVVLTNGCGSLNAEWGPGTAVLLRDHLNLTGATPLRGATFVDLTDAYSPRLRDLAREVDGSLPEGVYAQLHGPQYETPAEVRMVGVLGGDLVGMSTALETIAARALGLEVLGLSLVTNLAAGTSGQALDHQEVLDAGREAAERCGRLLAAVVDRVSAA